jgi:hypothetical protein
MKFRSLDSLKPVSEVIGEAGKAIKDKTRTITMSGMPDLLVGALGAGIGGACSFTALYGLGTVGLSAAGITSGLATAGAIVGGGMTAGIFVLAAPVAVSAGIGVGFANKIRNKKVRQLKERLYQEALRKHDAILTALKNEMNQTKERAEYLNSLNILLAQAIKDMKEDLFGQETVQR